MLWTFICGTITGAVLVLVASWLFLEWDDRNRDNHTITSSPFLASRRENRKKDDPSLGGKRRIGFN
jgi:hypothetical protein